MLKDNQSTASSSKGMKRTALQQSSIHQLFPRAFQNQGRYIYRWRCLMWNQAVRWEKPLVCNLLWSTHEIPVVWVAGESGEVVFSYWPKIHLPMKGLPIRVKAWHRMKDQVFFIFKISADWDNKLLFCTGLRPVFFFFVHKCFLARSLI